MTPGRLSKTQWRGAMRRRLAELDPTATRAAAVAVADRVMALPVVAHSSVALCCLSFGHEFETRPLIDRLLAAGHQVCLPRCVEGTHTLTVHPFPCPLEKLPFGLEQPVAGCGELAADQVEVALLVGLAFDTRGFRLGHGGGYFDRFLAAHTIPAVGLAYDFQILDRLPALQHDIAMNAVITESRHLRAGR